MRAQFNPRQHQNQQIAMPPMSTYQVPFHQSGSQAPIQHMPIVASMPQTTHATMMMPQNSSGVLPQPTVVSQAQQQQPPLSQAQQQQQQHQQQPQPVAQPQPGVQQMQQPSLPLSQAQQHPPTLPAAPAPRQKKLIKIEDPTTGKEIELTPQPAPSVTVPTTVSVSEKSPSDKPTPVTSTQTVAADKSVALDFAVSQRTENFFMTTIFLF